MPIFSTSILKNKQKRLLLVYDLYRLISIALFLGLFFYIQVPRPYDYFYCSILLGYFACSAIFLYVWRIIILSFERQVLISGTVDVIAISLMLSIIGHLQPGYGILLNVTIAALSILVPGRLAIYFASLASCLLLTGNLMDYLIAGQKDLGSFFYSGIYGAGFFCTALTAWYLANWVHLSENLAQNRSDELAGLQRINEYIVGRLHSGIIYVVEEKRIKLINSAARRFFNVAKDAATAPQYLQQLSSLLSVKFDNFLVQVKRNDTSVQTILEEPYLKVHFFSNGVSHNPEVLIILEDMTHISQQAQQLKLAALGRFSASIAHELRNPLGAIAHAVQLFGDEGGLNEEDGRLKQLIINNCSRMNSVIKNVLQLSRRQKSQPEFIEASSFLGQFKLEFTQQNPCDFTVDITPSDSSSLVFDKSQLEQVLVVLCENAMQHGRNKEGKVSIVISLKCINYKTILTVSDSGLGIPKEHRDNVFEPFFTTLRSGTGMGLFIARDLCEINQARLNLVKSNNGSSFAITLNSSDDLII